MANDKIAVLSQQTLALRPPDREELRQELARDLREMAVTVEQARLTLSALTLLHIYAQQHRARTVRMYQLLRAYDWLFDSPDALTLFEEESTARYLAQVEEIVEAASDQLMDRFRR